MPVKKIGLEDSAPRISLRFVLIGLALAGSLAAGSSFARPYYATGGEKRFHHRAESEKRQKAEEPAPPAGPLFFVISTNKQHVSVYSSNGLYARSPVSTGRPDHPTPHGIFSIIGKERYHRSNIYSGAPMPYMQRITWSGVAMHEGVLPGYAASHGCVRMPHEFARRLFGYTRGNERVVISRQDVVPASISHPRLFEPKLMEAPGSGNIASGSAQILQHAIAQVSGRNGGAEKLDVAVNPEAGEAKPSDGGQKLLNPFEFAKAMQARAAKQASEAAAALSPARIAIGAKAKEVREAVVAVRKAEIGLANAKDRLEAADRQAKQAPAGEEANAAAAAREQAAAKAAEAEAALSSAQRGKAEKEQDAANALKAYNDADYARRVASDAVKAWNRRLAPLSIFITRKTQRLYIRQGFTKVFDVPVTIRDPEKPLGTHLFMAMPGGAPDATPGVHWLVLTIPDASTATEEPRRHRHRHSWDEDDDAPRADQPAASASEALDRIEVPAEVREKISEMLWTGSSLIVSDKAMSGETGEYTDFVILTR
ncbi:MAG: L,D-transpeptidase [Rhodomicrobium sp.]